MQPLATQYFLLLQPGFGTAFDFVIITQSVQTHLRPGTHCLQRQNSTVSTLTMSCSCRSFVESRLSLAHSTLSNNCRNMNIYEPRDQLW